MKKFFILFFSIYSLNVMYSQCQIDKQTPKDVNGEITGFIYSHSVERVYFEDDQNGQLSCFIGVTASHRIGEIKNANFNIDISIASTAINKLIIPRKMLILFDDSTFMLLKADNLDPIHTAKEWSYYSTTFDLTLEDVKILTSKKIEAFNIFDHRTDENIIFKNEHPIILEQLLCIIRDIGKYSK